MRVCNGEVLLIDVSQVKWFSLSRPLYECVVGLIVYVHYLSVSRVVKERCAKRVCVPPNERATS